MSELNLKEIFTIFWNKKLQIIIITIFFVLVGIIYSYFIVVPQYESYTSLLLAKDSPSSNDNTTSISQTDLTLNQELVSTYSELIKSKSVIREVKDNLNLSESDNDLKKDIVVTFVKDTELLKITVTNENPNTAMLIANDIANVFTVKIKDIYNINNVYIVDTAEASINAANVNHIKDLLIFLFVGFVLSNIYILAANMLDTTVKNVDDIEKELSLVVIGTIPDCSSSKMKGVIAYGK